MNDFRKWMRLIEAQNKNPQHVRVFHGTQYDPAHTFKLLPEMLYGVRDFGFAASYGLARGENDAAWVLTLEFTFQNLCDTQTLDALFDKHGIEPWPSAAGVFIEHPEFVNVLTEEGYDGLYAYDFGFRNDFEELPCYMVVNAAKQARIIKSEVVSRDDLTHKHEPT